MTLTLKNIEDALWMACFDSLSGSRNTARHLRFETMMEELIPPAARKLYDRTYTLQPARVSMSHYPVKREIFTPAVTDSIVSHMLYQMLYPMYEQLFDDDCYSCRKGRGTLYGINRLEHHLRSVSENWTKPCYVYLYDIAGYFISIDHDVVYGFVEEDLHKLSHRRVPDSIRTRGIVSRREARFIVGKYWKDIRDMDFILWLSKLFINRKATENVLFLSPKSEWDDYPAWKSAFNAPEGRSLIIGDVSNQLFSNVNGMRIDRFFKHTLQARHYGRYVDDGYSCDRDPERLKEMDLIFRQFLKDNLHQSIHPTKVRVMDAYKGVDYLGARILPFRRYVSARTVSHFMSAIDEIDSSLADKPTPKVIADAMARINSMLGHMKHFKSFSIRKRLADFRSICRVFDFDDSFLRARPATNIDHLLTF